jgi:alpha-mannosidase
VNQKDTLIAIRRIDQFYRRATRSIIADSVLLKATCGWSTDPVSFEERTQLAYTQIEEGAIWGRTWESAWFHLSGAVPSSWRGKTVVAQLDFGGEGLVFLPNGQIVQGITNGSVFDTEFGRDIVRLLDTCVGGEVIELWVEAAANGLFGMFCDLDPDARSTNRYGLYDAKVNSIRLGIFDTTTWELTLDLRVLLGLIKGLPEQSVRRARIIKTAIEGLNAFATSDDNPRVFREILARELSKPATASSLSVTAVGHAHIDTAWLWPVKESIRKCARTFATQLDLIDRYPEYIFGASQAQHYAFVKERYPELYERVKAAVKAGRWEVQGGMWVEADCNVPSGESLVRQILQGKNFFRDEFGVDVDNLWLPDVFGYSAALPQILLKSGINYFLTQKLSWNQINEFPFHTFKWQGIDGSEVLTHFPPENTYNSQLAAESLVTAQDQFKEKDYIDEFISLFGVGDGGGGPKEEHIQMGRRMTNLEGAPRVRFGSAKDFFHRLAKHCDEVPTWVGELYLELHRGTLTTQAFVKWANRRLEHKLRALEMLCSCLSVDNYPQKSLDDIWKTVLINQFHDIIPGSSIWRVYRLANEQYREALSSCDAMMTDVASKLLERNPGCVTLFNSLHYPYEGAVLLPTEWSNFTVKDADGNVLPSQTERDQLVVQVNMAPYSFITLTRVASGAKPPPPAKGLVLDNELVRYEFTEQGTLCRCFDKEIGREIIPPDRPGNVLTLYEDRPNDWDAWDIDAFYRDVALERARVIKAEPLPSGEVRQGLLFRYRVGQSQIDQRVYLGRSSKRLDFETVVDWHEKHRMLRVAFPVTVRTDQATFDIQYGFLRRSTHRNTSWEQARFEVVGHRYADLSDQDYGVALLNDSKYGYHVENGLLDLNLLRSPNYPDPDADQGEHHFVYSLLPHAGDLAHSEVIREAAKLNQGLMILDGFSAGNRIVPARLTGEGISLEVMKRAEKEDCLVLRIVETHGRHSSGQLVVDVKGAILAETDLLEWSDGEQISADAPVELKLNPFEIRTFKLKLDTARKSFGDQTS